MILFLLGLGIGPRTGGGGDAVLDPDFDIRGVPGHPDPEIAAGGRGGVGGVAISKHFSIPLGLSLV